MAKQVVDILTFLFTDIEGSTRQWESDPEAMNDAVRTHDELIKSAIAGHNGTFVKQTGDGVFASFRDAGDAVAAAIEAQEGFTSADWASTGQIAVRMGVHSGTAVSRADDYFGNEVNRTARLMGIAHGGQILVSDVTAELAGTGLSPMVSLEDLGMHRLRDLSEPVRVYQVVTPVLGRQFPALRSVDGYPNNLPAAMSSFVGRSEDVRSSVDQLASHRLLSLTGAGGSGKTRLGLQVAAELLPDFKDGAWFVDLSGLTEPDLVPQAAAATLRLNEKAGRRWIDVLSAYVGVRNLLLIFDNCEHLLDSAAATVGELLRTAPDLKVLATTREPLNLPGEISWRVPTMQLPTDSDSMSLDEILDYEAVQLFVERALAARPMLEFTDQDAPAIAEVCRRLDGLPLALELAAARVRVLSVADIARHLDDRFSLLGSGSRTALPRQQTLEGTVAWSFDLLEDEERELFQRLSVFSGGFGLDAAFEVAWPDSLIGITSLVEKSLLLADTAHDATRYRMLETVAAFGRQRLGHDLAEARNAHLAWATELAKKAAGELEGRRQAEWLDRISAELDNLRAAMQWSLNGGDSVSGMTIAGSLYRYWFIRGVREGRHWLDLFLDADPPASPQLEARVLFAAGSLIQVQGDYGRAAELLDESLRIATEQGADRLAAYALHYLIRARWGDVSAEELRVMIDTALSEFRKLDDPVGISLTLVFDALWHLQYGSAEDAEDGVTELIRLTESIGSPQLLAHGAEIPAVVACFQGDLDTAAVLLNSAAGHYQQIGNQQCTGHYLENTAVWAQRSGRPHEAAVLLGGAKALREDTGIPTPVYENFLFDETLTDAKANLGDRFDDEWDKGQAMSMEKALEYAQKLTATT